MFFICLVIFDGVLHPVNLMLLCVRFGYIPLKNVRFFSFSLFFFFFFFFAGMQLSYL